MGILNPSAAFTRDCSALQCMQWCLQCALAARGAALQTAIITRYNVYFYASMEFREKTVYFSKWPMGCSLTPLSQYICILLICCFLRVSSFDRLGTGNVICYLPGVLFLSRRESPGQSLNVARPPLPLSPPVWKAIKFSNCLKGLKKLFMSPGSLSFGLKLQNCKKIYLLQWIECN